MSRGVKPAERQVNREGLRTSMDEQQRNGTVDFAAFMDVVDIQGLEAIHDNIPGKLGHLGVEVGFVFSPVIAVLPSFDEALDGRERRAIVPTCGLELVRKPGESKFLLEDGEVGIGNGDFERRLGGRRHGCGEESSKEGAILSENGDQSP